MTDAEKLFNQIFKRWTDLATRMVTANWLRVCPEWLHGVTNVVSISASKVA
jgi:hypothetical protein